MANETKEHEFTVRMNGSIEDYHVAPGGDGPLADEWADKPHRLLYDLLGEIQALRRERSAAVESLKKARRVCLHALEKSVALVAVAYIDEALQQLQGVPETPETRNRA